MKRVRKSKYAIQGFFLSVLVNVNVLKMKMSAKCHLAQVPNIAWQICQDGPMILGKENALKSFMEDVMALKICSVHKPNVRPDAHPHRY